MEEAKKYLIYYKAGGYPMPTYRGHMTIFAFPSSVKQKAIREVCREMQMSPMSVIIEKIEELYD